MRRLTLSAAAGATALLLASCSGTVGADGSKSADAKDFPTDTITLLVPYSAGGPTDHIARSVAKGMEGQVDETVVVKNRPGASGTLAVNELLSSEADGHTIAIVATPSALIPPALGQAEYQVSDFAPIGVVAEQPIALLVNADTGPATGKQFVETAQQDPGSFIIGTNGPTTSAGIAVNRLVDDYDLPVKQVPFEGQSELLTAVLGGNVDAIVANTSPETLQRIDSGDLRAVAVFGPERLPYLADVPTLQELGFTEVTHATSRFGLVAPSGTPQQVQEVLAEALQQVLEDPDVVEQLGERYVPDTFVSGSEWEKRMTETAQVYENALSS